MGEPKEMTGKGSAFSGKQTIDRWWGPEEAHDVARNRAVLRGTRQRVSVKGKHYEIKDVTR